MKEKASILTKCVLGSILAFVLMFGAVLFSSFRNVEEIASPQADGYSISRQYWDPVSSMRIYTVKTPHGTYHVLWESTKGGMCLLK